MTAGPIRVLVAEDETIARKKIVRWVREEPGLELVGEARSGPEALRLLDREKPDLLFLDVHMPGMTGIDVLARAAWEPAVVFTTAYEEYAVTAFEADAVDYLLKPFGPSRFGEALERVRRRVAQAPSGAGKAFLRRLIAIKAGRTIVVPVDTVRRFEACDDYVAAWAESGRHLLATRMATLDERLDPERFVRVHRSHIVRLACVRAWSSLGGGRWEIELDDDTRVACSRSGTRRLRPLLKDP